MHIACINCSPCFQQVQDVDCVCLVASFTSTTSTRYLGNMACNLLPPTTPRLLYVRMYYCSLMFLQAVSIQDTCMLLLKVM